MKEERLVQDLLEAVRSGSLPRRGFMQQMLGLGLSAPMAATLLMNAGLNQPAQAAPADDYKPTKRGGGGALKTLWWQGPTLLQPHFAGGLKDREGSRVFYEPLAVWDQEGNLVPVLAAEIPTVQNGDLLPGAKVVRWRLKKGVTWHDGQPFTADDCVFTWEFARDPATACVTAKIYQDVTVTKVDSHTILVSFPKASPFWANAFVSSPGMIIPKHLFAPYAGAKSREAPTNLKPVGTGPYKFSDFKPGDLIRGEINHQYHVPNRPHFDSIEVKGGGDATSAARAVLQTGEFDYAWNLLVEDDVLKRMESGGKGRVAIADGGSVEFLLLNPTDPFTEVDGERSSVKTKHFAFSDPAVRQAMAQLIDRQSMQDHIYGRSGKATNLFINNPARFRSPSNKLEFSVDKANALLDAAGWKRGADGVREKAGRKLRFVYQTSTNSSRQKMQMVIKQACQKAGIDIEIKAVAGSVFFSTDAGNPDTYGKFYADLQSYANTMTQPDPGRYMEQFLTREICSKTNKWALQNISRWSSDEYDKVFAATEVELDAAKRIALFIKMNDMILQAGHCIPLLTRPFVRGVAHKLVAPASGWDLDFARLHDWYRTA
jgi:peptide/nickel transport system substrate-binding protein